MNKIHCLIWNNARQTWIVAHEAAASRSKPASRTKRLLGILAGSLLAHAAAAAPTATALPSGGQVVAGQAAISQSGSAMQIRQTSDKAILNWNSFNIGDSASVQFLQPSSSAIALNRVVGNDASAIFGTLTANGQVFLINPNGVLFGQGARVDVGGLVASSLALRNEDFLAGNFRFRREAAGGSVINQGDIVAHYAALLAPEVHNDGVIAARYGTVALAAGEAITLGIAGNRLIDVQVEQASIDTLVENRHLIRAGEGTVLLSAQSAHTLLGRVVNSGSIDASGIDTSGGTVRLVASSHIDHRGSIAADGTKVGAGGTVIVLADLANSTSQTTVSGTISARGGDVTGNGGFVETSATHLSIADSARIDTRAPRGAAGQWLLDPYDFTIAATGGDITGAALATALASNNVTIQTTNSAANCTNATCGAGNGSGNGDIIVNDNVSWGTNTLTLDAWRHIDIKAKLSATGNGGLTLQYGQNAVAAGNTAMLRIGTAVDLAGTAAFKTRLGSNGSLKNYIVITSLGAEGSATGTDLQGITNFSGNYVLGSDIDATATSGWNSGVGFTPIAHGSTFTGTFEGLGHTVRSLTINRSDNVRTGLFGEIVSGGVVQNIHVREANIANSNTGGNATVGILAGRNAGIIAGATSSGSVSTANTGGGLVGVVGSGGVLERSSSSARVTGGDYTYIGGLVGLNYGNIRNVFATGNVVGTGTNGPGAAAGLIGDTGFGGSTLTNAYASGQVSGSGTLRGLVGAGSGTVINGYYNSSSTGRSDTTLGSQPKTSSEMQQQSTFTGWDFTTVWQMGVASPVFQLGAGPLSQLYVRLLAGSSTYGTTPTLNFAYYDAASGGNQVSLSGATGSATWSTALSAASTANSYSLTYTGNLASDGYQIAAGTATAWTISPKPLNLSVSKTYDGNAGFSSGFSLAGIVGSDSVTLSGSANVASANANAYNSFASSSLTLSNSNYTLSGGSVSATINAKPLNLSVSRTYDGNAGFSSGFSLAGIVGSDSVTLSGSANVASANANAYNSFASSSLTLSNSNYTLSGGSVSATINPKPLGINVTKEWNNSTSFTGGFSLTGMVGSDSVTVTGGSATVSSPNVATYSGFTNSTLILSNSNYTLAGGTVSAVITPEPYFTGPHITSPQTVANIGTITGGRASFTVTPASTANNNTITLTQTDANGLYLIWSNFTLPIGYTLNFNQLTSGTQRGAHNSITSSSPTQIWGRLQSNGPVFFYAPAGFVFTPFASVDIGSLSAIAMTPVIPATSAGTITYSGNAGVVRNETNLSLGKVGDSGQTLLRGNEVINDGTLTLLGTGTLTLKADNSIRINSPIDLSGSSALAFEGNYEISAPVNLTNTNRFSVNGEAYTVITDLAGLRNMNSNSNWALGKNIDASATSTTPFAAIDLGYSSLAGLGHTVGKFKGNGLIRGNFYGRLSDIGLTEADITLSGGTKGGLVSLNIGTIHNSYITGTVKAGNALGEGVDMAGLVGENRDTISNSAFIGNVTGVRAFAGLVKRNSSYGKIINSYFSGDVNWTNSTPELEQNRGIAIGGLVYENWGRTENSYFSGSVQGRGNQVGGFAVYNTRQIINSYFTGSISVTNYTVPQAARRVVADSTGSTSNQVTELSATDALLKTKYTGFNFTSPWTIAEATSTPWLRGQPRPPSTTTGTATQMLMYNTVAAALAAAYTAPATVMAQNKFTAQANALVAAFQLSLARQTGSGASSSSGLAIDFAKQAITAYCPKCTFSDADYLKWVTP